MPRTINIRGGGTAVIPDIGVIEFSKDSGNDFVPAIPAGEIYILNYKGKPLPETKELRSFMPFLNAYISNQSDQNIRVQIGDQKRSGYSIGSKRSRAISEIPFTELTIYNLGASDIHADEIKIICNNDLTAILRYAEAVNGNLIDPIIFRR